MAKKDLKKKENLKKIIDKKRENPKNLKGNLNGLDLDVKNSILLFNNKIKQ